MGRFFHPFLLIFVLVLTVLAKFVACEPNYYKVLGVASKASADEIKKNYRTLAKKYHPDKNRDNANAADKFIEITKAYEVLTDPQQRAAFDDSLRYGNTGSSRYNSNHPFGSHDSKVHNWRSQRPRSNNMDDVFRDFYNQFEDPQEETTTTYMFRGPDGRVYYTTKKNKGNNGNGRHNNNHNNFNFQYSTPDHQPESLMEYLLYSVLWPLLQFILFLLFLSSMCSTCCGNQQKKLPPRRENTADHFQPHSTMNEEDESSQQEEELAQQRRHLQQLLNPYSFPLATAEIILEQRARIIVVALTPTGLALLNKVKAQFRRDPIVFCIAFHVEEWDENISSPTELLAQAPIYPLLRSLPENVLDTCDVIAFKQAKKYAMCDRANHEVFADWLEQLLQGQIYWNTI